MKNNILFLLFVWLTLATTTLVTAQKNEIDATYRIRLGAYSKTFDKNTAFKNVEDLGTVGFENADNGFTRAYLGFYLGKSTAQKVLATAKKRGYKEAYIVRDNYEFVNMDGSPQSRTLQLIAIEKLDVRAIAGVLSLQATTGELDNNLYIWYDKGVYRLCLGLFAPNMPTTIDAYNNLATRLGFSQTLERSFRKSPIPVPAPKPAALPTDPVIPTNTKSTPAKPNTPTTPLLSKQDSIELMNKISGNNKITKPVTPQPKDIIKDTIKATPKPVVKPAVSNNTPTPTPTPKPTEPVIPNNTTVPKAAGK